MRIKKIKISLNVYPGVVQKYNIHTCLTWGPKQKGGSRHVISRYYELQRMIRNVSYYRLLFKYVVPLVEV